MYYSQIVAKRGDSILSVRSSRNKNEQDKFMIAFSKRFPNCEIEVRTKNFIDGSSFNSSWRLSVVNFMEWWANLNGRTASRLAKTHLNLDWHLNLTKEQIQAIYLAEFNL